MPGYYFYWLYFHYLLLNMWHDIDEIKAAKWINSVATFKRHLKTILFTLAYGVTDN